MTNRYAAQLINFYVDTVESFDGDYLQFEEDKKREQKEKGEPNIELTKIILKERIELEQNILVGGPKN